MLSALLALCAGSPTGDSLGTPQPLTDGAALLMVSEGHADLVLFDLDGDGAKDMVVGQFKDGLVRFYKNRAKEGLPTFDGFELLKAAGSEIKVDAG